MPSYPCKHPTCSVYLKAPGYCPAHEAAGKTVKARVATHYDQHVRNQESKTFYNSAAWIRTRAAKLAENPWCERCEIEWAAHVHHVTPILKDPSKRLDPANLMSVCAPCHNAEEAEIRKADACTSG